MNLLNCALAATLASLAATPQAPTPWRWYAVQLHAHTKYSDGYHDLGAVVRWAREEGLDAIALTDHNTNRHLADPAYRTPQGVTLIPAYEWTEHMGEKTEGIPTERCHINVWGIDAATELLPFSLTKSQMLARARLQGVTLGANHPFEPRFPWPDEDFTGVSTLEVWQWQYGFEEGGKPQQGPMPPRGGWTWGEFLVRNARAIALWQRVLARGQHLTPVAVCDFHLGLPAQDVASPCTLVWSPTASVPDLLANLRAGHVTLVERPHAPRVELRSGPALSGDTVPLNAPLSFHVTRGAGNTLSIFDAGGLVSRREVRQDDQVETLSATRPGYYWARLDRHRPFNSLVSLAGALYVSPAPPAAK